MATILQANSQLIDWVVDLGFCSPWQFFIFFSCSHAYHLLAEEHFADDVQNLSTFVKDLCFLQSPKPTLDTPIGFEGFNFCEV
jgi:hypothetical protein